MDKGYVDTTKVTVSPIASSVAKEIIVTNHYSHAWTKATYCFGVYYATGDSKFFDDNKTLIGTIVYGDPIGRQTVKSICPSIENGEVLELTRAWIADGFGSNIESYSISQTFKWLKSNVKKVKVIISYSDPEQGHVGTMYQALNFFYQGDQTRKIDAYWFRFSEDGEWMHPRTVMNKYGTVQEPLLRKIIGHSWYIKELKRKHRYIYFLCDKDEKKRLMAELKHPILEYPTKQDLHEEKIIKINV